MGPIHGVPIHFFLVMSLSLVSLISASRCLQDVSLKSFLTCFLSMCSLWRVVLHAWTLASSMKSSFLVSKAHNFWLHFLIFLVKVLRVEDENLLGLG